MSIIIAHHGRARFTAITRESFDAGNKIIITRLQDKLEVRNKQEN